MYYFHERTNRHGCLPREFSPLDCFAKPLATSNYTLLSRWPCWTAHVICTQIYEFHLPHGIQREMILLCDRIYGTEYFSGIKVPRWICIEQLLASLPFFWQETTTGQFQGSKLTPRYQNVLMVNCCGLHGSWLWTAFQIQT